MKYLNLIKLGFKSYFLHSIFIKNYHSASIKVYLKKDILYQCTRHRNSFGFFHVVMDTYFVYY